MMDTTTFVEKIVDRNFNATHNQRLRQGMLSTGTVWYNRLPRPESLNTLFGKHVLTKHEQVQVIVNCNYPLQGYLVTRTRFAEQPLSCRRLEGAMTKSTTEEEFVLRARGLWQEINPEETVLTGQGGQSSIPQLPVSGAISHKASGKPTSQLSDNLVSLPEGHSSSLALGSSSIPPHPPNHCFAPPIKHKILGHHPTPTLLNPGQFSPLSSHHPRPSHQSKHQSMSHPPSTQLQDQLRPWMCLTKQATLPSPCSQHVMSMHTATTFFPTRNPAPHLSAATGCGSNNLFLWCPLSSVSPEQALV